jgi:hypothetical protein
MRHSRAAAQHRCFVGFAGCFILLVSRLRRKDGLMDNLGLMKLAIELAPTQKRSDYQGKKIRLNRALA